tara:strand:+ start:206 stop:529 length:324 start_codon:yes stop_codon:yes gene_type:complete
MKKIILGIFTIIFTLSVTNVIACKTCGCQSKDGKIKTECNTGEKKVCDKAAKKTCCKSKDKSVKGFNFNNKNVYGNKTTCSKTSAKKCCKTKEKVKENDVEENNEDK